VVFKIKTLNTLILGDTFSNDTAIYFDFNFLIITNDFVTTVAENLSVNEFDSNFHIKLYPNPMTEVLQITSEFNIGSVTIYDVNGRVLQNIVFLGNDLQRAVNLERYTKGVYFVKLISGAMDSTYKILKD
jgi:hypothetical protein